ncbi:hypothetical protein HRG_001263 [Hirsutella rhossiliensis]|uniref:Uncharacterized protein n=1 Tax=Hirsutella rhossiliensis TaxID=111463 RepID=A0A9P8N9T0_9HYPO|nr:uncharacterized protein HRG_01263 [Hirsutella rhossiliensis]KAH0968621.1 hypothetical protein HRG_01263 [Hirsutella rhossiliensis]
MTEPPKTPRQVDHDAAAKTDEDKAILRELQRELGRLDPDMSMEDTAWLESQAGPAELARVLDGEQEFRSLSKEEQNAIIRSGDGCLNTLLGEAAAGTPPVAGGRAADLVGSADHA